tara:strand:+ start:1471 stop:2553 length:1083 start_codon:yes stop_codon:yes gene_type:complete
MAYTTINKSTDHFNSVIYTGDGNSTQAITNTFQPDFSWIKHRDTTAAHSLQDVLRGYSESKKLCSNTADAENNASGATWGDYGGISAVGSNSFTVYKGSQTPYQSNASGANYASWHWKAGTTSGLSGGTITPVSYTVNTTAGFGIYKYYGTGSTGTIAHGLPSAPKMIIIKRRNGGNAWQIYHHIMGNTKFIEFSSSSQQTGTSRWNDTTPTSSVFTIGNDSDVNGSGSEFIAYAWCDVPGYCKAGGYIGNGASGAPDADGTFVYTGFKPKFIMVKSYSNSGAWTIWDNKRAGYNPNSYRIEAHANNAEYQGTAVFCNQLSNGFKLVQGDTDTNGDGYYYIYLAIGQSMVGSNNVPCTAR